MEVKIGRNICSSEKFICIEIFASVKKVIKAFNENERKWGKHIQDDERTVEVSLPL